MSHQVDMEIRRGTDCPRCMNIYNTLLFFNIISMVWWLINLVFEIIALLYVQVIYYFLLQFSAFSHKIYLEHYDFVFVKYIDTFGFHVFF